jgi:hypothetical protein
VWFGDMQLSLDPSTLLPWTGSLPPGDPPTESGRLLGLHNRETGIISGYVQLYDGRGTQAHVDEGPPAGAFTQLGQAMLANGVDEITIPGYRGYVSIAHFHNTSFEAQNRAQWGASPNLAALSYEVSCYPGTSDAMNVGLEANPAEVIIDILIGQFGKLGLDASKIHGPSFLNAKIRFQEEGNGYSRAIEAGVPAKDILREITEQTASVIFEDNRDGLIHIKLIRPDYDPTTLPHLTPSNCQLESFDAAGIEGVPNKVRVIYRDRNNDYQEKSVSADNQAVAVGQDNEARELVLDCPGVCTRELAEKIAARELSARSRPLAKCTAIVGREFYTVNPGDPVKLTWPKYGVDGRVFRVAGPPSRGTLENGRIRLELVEDFFFSWRGAVDTLPPLETHGVHDGTGLEAEP